MGFNPEQKCIECGAQTATSKTMRCATCKTKVAYERSRTYLTKWRAANPEKAKARAEAQKAKRPPGPGNPFYGNGKCIDCAAPTLGLMKRCLACKAIAEHASKRKWDLNNHERRLARLRIWGKQNPARNRPAWRRWYEARKAERALVRATRAPLASRVLSPSGPLLAYPFVAKARDEHAELLLVNSLVPRGMPGREDVVQAILLALWERQTTIEQLKAAGIAPFLRQFRRDNYESGGYAVSLDVPRLGGGSWHDVLPGSAA